MIYIRKILTGYLKSSKDTFPSTTTPFVFSKLQKKPSPSNKKKKEKNLPKSFFNQLPLEKKNIWV